jgi:hypothetical protein
MEDPEVRAEIERRAASRAGNLRQQADANEAKWSRATEHMARIQALPEAEYKETMADPGVAQWVANYRNLEAQRNAPPPPVDAEAIRSEVLQQGLGEWNVAAAKAFGATLKGTDLWQDIPAEARQHLEAGSQSKTDGVWLDEYLGYLDKAHETRNRRLIATAVEAAKNEMRAEGSGEQPVIMQGAQGEDLSPKEILQRHMDYGTDTAHGGVTEEQLSKANKALGRDW